MLINHDTPLANTLRRLTNVRQAELLRRLDSIQKMDLTTLRQFALNQTLAVENLHQDICDLEPFLPEPGAAPDVTAEQSAVIDLPNCELCGATLSQETIDLSKETGTCTCQACDGRLY